jgi:hypothetical protein
MLIAAGTAADVPDRQAGMGMPVAIPRHSGGLAMNQKAAADNKHQSGPA